MSTTPSSIRTTGFAIATAIVFVVIIYGSAVPWPVLGDSSYPTTGGELIDIDGDLLQLYDDVYACRVEEPGTCSGKRGAPHCHPGTISVDGNDASEGGGPARS